MPRYKCDGNVRVITLEDLRPGHVLRETSVEHVDVGLSSTCSTEVYPTYSDSTIVDISADDRGLTQVRLVRPFLYSTGVGTTSKHWLMGVEDIKVEASRLVGEKSIYRIVLLASGLPHKMER